ARTGIESHNRGMPCRRRVARRPLQAGHFHAELPGRESSRWQRCEPARSVQSMLLAEWLRVGVSGFRECRNLRETAYSRRVDRGRPGGGSYVARPTAEAVVAVGPAALSASDGIDIGCRTPDRTGTAGNESLEAGVFHPRRGSSGRLFRPGAPDPVAQVLDRPNTLEDYSGRRAVVVFVQNKLPLIGYNA